MSKVCEGLDLYRVGFFKNLFPRAAGPTAHLEVTFTPECPSCAALLPGAPACLWENTLCEPKLLELITAIPDRSLVMPRSVISTDTEDALSANSSQSLLRTSASTPTSAGACGRGTLTVTAFLAENFCTAAHLFKEKKNYTFSSITFLTGSGFPAAMQYVLRSFIYC